jgi:translocator protein
LANNLQPILRDLSSRHLTGLFSGHGKPSTLHVFGRVPTNASKISTMSRLAVQPPNPGKRSKVALVGFLAATYLVAIVSTVFTAPAIATWYATLAKPGFNPPNQLFGPVWTLLYTLMAIAAWRVWKRPACALRTRAIGLFRLQLVLNFAWSIIFFHQHQLGLAFGEILLLWLAILLTMLFFFRLARPAGWMMVPYLAWVSFASVLNFAIWRLN